MNNQDVPFLGETRRVAYILYVVRQGKEGKKGLKEFPTTARANNTKLQVLKVEAQLACSLSHKLRGFQNALFIPVDVIFTFRLLCFCVPSPTLFPPSSFF